MTAYSQRFVREEGDPFRIDLFAAYRTKLGERDAKIQLNWQNATDSTYRDRRAYFVVPATLRLSVDLAL